MPALAPFGIRSFRYQWPADLATSWAFEMETLVMSWYVLTETNSVLLLTLYASLQYIGTLLAPLFGVAGDRIGRSTVLCAARASYTLLAAVLTALILLPSVMGAMGQPAYSAMLPDLVPPDELMAILSLGIFSWNSGRVVGPIVASLMAVALGPAWTEIGRAHV